MEFLIHLKHGEYYKGNVKNSFARVLYFSHLAQSRWDYFMGCFWTWYPPDTPRYISSRFYQRHRLIVNDTHARYIGSQDRISRTRHLGRGRGNPLTMEISPFPGMAFCMRRAGGKLASPDTSILTIIVWQTRGPLSLSSLHL